MKTFVPHFYGPHSSPNLSWFSLKYLSCYNWEWEISWTGFHTPWISKMEYDIFCSILAPIASWNSIHQNVGIYWAVCVAWLPRFAHIPGEHPAFGIGRDLGKDKEDCHRSSTRCQRWISCWRQNLQPWCVCQHPTADILPLRLYDKKLLMTIQHSRLYSGIWLRPFFLSYNHEPLVLKHCSSIIILHDKV